MSTPLDDNVQRGKSQPGLKTKKVTTQSQQNIQIQKELNNSIGEEDKDGKKTLQAKSRSQVGTNP